MPYFLLFILTTIQSSDPSFLYMPLFSHPLAALTLVQVEERRKLGLVRFSLAMDDMRRLVDQAGFAEHEDSDEETDSARGKSGGKVAAKVRTFSHCCGFYCVHLVVPSLWPFVDSVEPFLGVLFVAAIPKLAHCVSIPAINTHSLGRNSGLFVLLLTLWFSLSNVGFLLTTPRRRSRAWRSWRTFPRRPPATTVSPPPRPTAPASDKTHHSNTFRIIKTS